MTTQGLVPQPAAVRPGASEAVRVAAPHHVEPNLGRGPAVQHHFGSVPIAPPSDRFEAAAEQTASRVLNLPEPAQTSDHVPAPLAPSGSGGLPLSSDLQAFMAPRFGLDLAAVRIHADLESARLNRELGAVAFTHRSDIYVRDAAMAVDRRVMAHELAHVAQQSASATSTTGPGEGVVQRMLACPTHLGDSEPAPAGFIPYHGATSVFHCGFRGILEDRIPSPADPQNECFYDHSGALVDANHPFAGCRGTPNQYDSAHSPLSHTFRDSGGIWAAGGPAFVTSRVHDVSHAISEAVAVVASVGEVVQSLGDAFGRAIALGLMTGIATTDPANWQFQGLPARSIRHLNVMGALLGSSALAGNPQVLLQNLTRRLDSFAIPGLLDEIAADANQALEAQGPGGRRLTAAELGTMSLLQTVEALRVLGLVSFLRPPEDIARERLEAQRPSQP